MLNFVKVGGFAGLIEPVREFRQAKRGDRVQLSAAGMAHGLSAGLGVGTILCDVRPSDSVAPVHWDGWARAARCLHRRFVEPALLVQIEVGPKRSKGGD